MRFAALFKQPDSLKKRQNPRNIRTSRRSSCLSASTFQTRRFVFFSSPRLVLGGDHTTKNKDMEELSFHPSSSSAQTPPSGGAVDQQQQENNNNNNNNSFFNAMPQMHHQYFQQPYPQHFNHQMHYPQSRFMHHPHHHPFGNVQRGTQFSPRARVGDWMCPNSCGLVFSSKTNCFRCGVSKPPGSVRLLPLHLCLRRGSVSMSFPYPSHSWF